MDVSTRERKSRRGPLCAYCRDMVESDPAICPGCSTALHAECCLELSQCPTLGCDKRPRDLLGESPIRVRARLRVQAGMGPVIGACPLCSEPRRADEEQHRCPGCGTEVHEACRQGRLGSPCPNRACGFGLDDVERYTPLFDVAGPMLDSPGHTRERTCALCFRPRGASVDTYTCPCGTSVHRACRERHLRGPCPNRTCPRSLDGVWRYSIDSPESAASDPRQALRGIATLSALVLGLVGLLTLAVGALASPETQARGIHLGWLALTLLAALGLVFAIVVGSAGPRR